MSTDQDLLIQCTGLDPNAPYSLGNKEYFYERSCNSGHKNLKDDEIGFIGGYYDGYNWTVPVCLRCVNAQEDKRIMVYSHSVNFHLKEVKIPENFTGLDLTVLKKPKEG